MASIMIHMAVTKKVNEILKMDERGLFLGTIAPDAAKQIGVSKDEGHFIDYENHSNIDAFLNKYRNYLNNPFEMGYLIHLITDNLWYKEFFTNYANGHKVRLLDGTIEKVTDEEYRDMIYNDYSDLNSQIIDYYNIDLSVFYTDYDFPKIYIKEIPNMGLKIMTDKIGRIGTTDGANNEYILEIEPVVLFIEYAVIYVIDTLKKKGII